LPTTTVVCVALAQNIGPPIATVMFSRRRPKVVALATSTARCTIATGAHSRMITSASAALQEATGKHQISANRLRLRRLGRQRQLRNALVTTKARDPRAARAPSRMITAVSAACQEATGKHQTSAYTMFSKRRPKVVALATSTARWTIARRTHSRMITAASAALQEAIGKHQISVRILRLFLGQQ